MNTQIVAESFLETALKKYTVDEAEIAILSKNCMALKVVSVVDKEGYKIVKQARSGVRGKRIEVEDTRKTEKAESLNFGRGIDARAKELTTLLTPIEEYLISQLKIVDDEELRIVNEKARLAQEVIDKAEAIKKKEEEDRQAKIKADQEAENARLEKIRIEQEATKRELREAQDKIDAENQKIAEDKEEMEREAHRQKDIETAQERAKVEVQEEVNAKTKKELLEKEQADKDEALRIALMPDNEKLAAFAIVIETIEMPTLSHIESHIILDDARIYLEKACKILKQ